MDITLCSFGGSFLSVCQSFAHAQMITCSLTDESQGAAEEIEISGVARSQTHRPTYKSIAKQLSLEKEQKDRQNLRRVRAALALCIAIRHGVMQALCC